MTSQPQRNLAQRNLAMVAFWMAGALLSFSAIALSVRALHGTLTIFEILVLRNVGGLLILPLMAVLAPEAGQRLVPAKPLVHLARNSIHFGGQALWAYGLTVLPLATVFAIEFTSPTWVAILAVLFLGERLTGARLASLVLGFAGVLVILRPGFDSFRPEALAVAAAAVCFAVQQTTTKFLTATNSTWTIMLWMNLMQLPLNLAANVAVGEPVWFAGKLDAALWLPILGIGVAGFTAHYCLTNAFRHGDAMLVTPIDFLRVPFIGLIGWLVYAEQPEPAVLVGAGIVVVGILINIYGESRSRG